MRLKPFDPGGSFSAAAQHTGSHLRRRAVRGAGVTFLSGGAGLVIQTIGTVVLARLLTPADFGLVAMVTTFSLLLVSFGENGLPEAIVQREEIDHGLASNLFWFNLGAGAVLTILFASAGSLLARLYSEARVQPVAIGVSLTILATSTSVLHLALLKRAMLFFEVSLNTILARLVSVSVAIAFAWTGWGHWALVAGAVALPISQSIGAWFLCRWVPGPPRRAAGTESTLRFAVNTYARFGVNYCTRNTDKLLVGWRFNAQSLGYYKKAYDLFSLSATQFVNSLTLVAVSALSRIDPKSAEYQHYLLRTLTVMAFLGMGLGGVLTLVGTDVIRVLLGPGWEEAGRIFTYFGPGVGALIFYNTHGWIHLSIGRADRWLRWGLVEFAVTAALFLAGLPWGPVGVALAWTASFWILLIPAMSYAGSPIGFQVGPVIAAIWRYLAASLMAGAATALIIRQSSFLLAAAGAAGSAIRIVIISLLFGALYLAAIVLLHRSLAPIHQVVRLLREMVTSSKRTA